MWGFQRTKVRFKGFKMDYSKIEAKERIKLAVKAMAKQDLAEVKLLSDSAPVESVVVSELAFSKALQGLIQSVTSFEMEMRGLALTFACYRGDDRGVVLGDCVDQATAAKKAWADFSADKGFSSQELMAVIGGHHQMVLNLFDTNLEPKPGLVEHWRSLLEFCFAGHMEVKGLH